MNIFRTLLAIIVGLIIIISVVYTTESHPKPSTAKAKIFRSIARVICGLLLSFVTLLISGSTILLIAKTFGRQIPILWGTLAILLLGSLSLTSIYLMVGIIRNWREEEAQELERKN